MVRKILQQIQIAGELRPQCGIAELARLDVQQGGLPTRPVVKLLLLFGGQGIKEVDHPGFQGVPEGVAEPSVWVFDSPGTR